MRLTQERSNSISLPEVETLHELQPEQGLNTLLDYEPDIGNELSTASGSTSGAIVGVELAVRMTRPEVIRVSGDWRRVRRRRAARTAKSIVRSFSRWIRVAAEIRTSTEHSSTLQLPVHRNGTINTDEPQETRAPCFPPSPLP
jgi:hypothetical protein